MIRHVPCKDCDTKFTTRLNGGRTPTVCADCAPEHIARLRSELAALREQVRNQDSVLVRRGRRVLTGEIGRQQLVAAVRRVAFAEGSADTRRALLEVCDVAETWAAKLEREPGEPA